MEKKSLYFIHNSHLIRVPGTHVFSRPGVNPPSTIPNPNPIPVDFLIPNPIPVNLAMIPNPIPIPVIFPSAIPNPNPIPISSY